MENLHKSGGDHPLLQPMDVDGTGNLISTNLKECMERDGMLLAESFA